MGVPTQKVVVPAIEPGVVGVFVTASVEASPAPHAFEAVTLIWPVVALAVASIELVVDAPVHPLGNVHV